LRITLGSNAKSSLRRKPTRGSNRRFPPPWTVEELDACFIVKDSSGQKLGYFYYEEEPGRQIRFWLA
jgi:hypothetical protein